MVYPKVPGLAAWSENCKWYSSLPLGAVVSLFCKTSEFWCHKHLCCSSTGVVVVVYFVIDSVRKLLDTPPIGCGYEVPGIVLLRDFTGSMRFDRSKDMSVHVTTCTSYDFNADKTHVFVRPVAKMGDLFSEQ
jgi:hypothetical protein